MADTSVTPANILPQADFVRSILSYDPASGEFRWKYRTNMLLRWNVRYAGKVSGAITKAGYRIISIGKVRYYAHRLAWLVMTGEWPEAEIDHKNRNTDDNRWSNLRAATPTQNRGNMGGIKGSAAGLKGVTKSAKCELWQARIGGRYLGLFKTPEAAHAAYMVAAAEKFGEFASDGKS